MPEKYLNPPPMRRRIHDRYMRSNERLLILHSVIGTQGSGSDGSSGAEDEDGAAREDDTADGSYSDGDPSGE